MINKHEEIALRAGVANSKIVMQLQTSAVGGNPSPANWLACSGLRVEFSRPNIAGAVLLPLTIDGNVLTLNFPDGFPEGDNVVRVSGNYGCCRFSYGVMVNADLYADIVETIEADPLVIETAAAGGGGDYKTDVYMDGDGRVMVERLEDGGTTIYDEHENPIFTRKADGTTEFYDAFQSVRQGFTEHGNVWFNIPDSGQLMFNGPIVHGQSVATGVNSFASGENSRATGKCSFVHGGGACTASANYAHAEGNATTASGQQSHAEGTGSKATANRAHAEGSYTEARAQGAHSEGFYTQTSTTATESHVQGVYNKPEGGAYSFIHGCGTSADDRRNAFLIAGDEVYVYGVGNYDGTNYGQEGVLSLRQVIAAL